MLSKAFQRRCHGDVMEKNIQVCHDAAARGGFWVQMGEYGRGSFRMGVDNKFIMLNIKEKFGCS
jgi:hypothetical protein